MDIFEAVRAAIPASALELFLRSTEVASYMPGRVRLYSRQMIGNPALETELRRRLGALAELDSVTTNAETGSILITYLPERLRANAELRRAEEYIVKHARRRA
ncbi:MAG: HMA2 domain-containing protein [Selenomonas artemidis]